MEGLMIKEGKEEHAKRREKEHAEKEAENKRILDAFWKGMIAIQIGLLAAILSGKFDNRKYEERDPVPVPSVEGIDRDGNQIRICKTD